MATTDGSKKCLFYADAIKRSAVISHHYRSMIKHLIDCLNKCRAVATRYEQFFLRTLIVYLICTVSLSLATLVSAMFSSLALFWHAHYSKAFSAVFLDRQPH